MDILLWLVPAALVTVLAAWGASVAARREEARRVSRERTDAGEEAGTGPGTSYDVPSWQELDDGVSAPRPARRPLDPAPREESSDGRRGHGDGPVRRSA